MTINPALFFIQITTTLGTLNILFSSDLQTFIAFLFHNNGLEFCVVHRAATPNSILHTGSTEGMLHPALSKTPPVDLDFWFQALVKAWTLARAVGDVLTTGSHFSVRITTDSSSIKSRSDKFTQLTNLSGYLLNRSSLSQKCAISK